MDDLRETIECLCNSPQRLKILDVLDGAWMDVREVMAALDSPRSTVQRNLSVLEEQGWVETAGSRYTTTTVGELLCAEFVEMNEIATKIERMAPFLNAVDAPAEVAVDQLSDVLVTTPEPTRPHSPRKRLSAIFEEADCVCGFLPVVSSLSVEEARRADAGSEPDSEYVVSSAAFDTLHDQYASEGVEGAEIDPPAHIDVRVYNGDLPYGLFVSDDALALAAYDEFGRIQVLVESTSGTTIEWGERVYEAYRRLSIRPHETDTPSVADDGELAE
jgi:predicted transcriptional regulator